MTESNKNTTPEEVVIGDRYRHFKGNEYTVLHIAKHSETEERMVVYAKEYGDHSVWVRPYDMFLDYKVVDGQLVKRFTRVSP